MLPGKVVKLAVLLLVLLVVACAPPGEEPGAEAPIEPIVKPETEPTAEPQTEPTVEPETEPTIEPTADAQVLDYEALVEALQAEGATVEAAGEVEQPFFSVDGRVIKVNDADVQVFEYADEAARQADSEKISPDGSGIGTTMVTWIDQPNFWAEGRLIVLYVGQDENILGLLNSTLGARVNEEVAAPVPEEESEESMTDTNRSYPEAVRAAAQRLSQSLDVAADQIEIISYQQAEWPDACLGLASANEMCAQVITPGWEIMLEAIGRTYEVHTDMTGSSVRWR